MVLFAHHSAMKDPPFMRLDLVACRNLLIYLERELQRQLLALFHYALKPGGFLFLGSAETADARPELFVPQDREHRVYTAKPRSMTTVELLNDLPSAQRQKAPPLLRREPDMRGFSPGAAHAAALEASAPPSVLVDEDHQVLHLSPNAGRFVAPPEGPLSQELPDIVRPELRAELRSALHRAFTNCRGDDHAGGQRGLQRRPAPGDDVRRPAAGERRRSPRRRWCCSWTAGRSVRKRTSTRRLRARSEATELRRMREELRSAQERLSSSRREHESAMQELRVANEELQSVNEEYRSTAEELETSKEELQSINEELQTVNAELKSKLENISPPTPTCRT